MTFRTLFQFAIKVYGLFLLKDIFLILGSFLTILSQFRNESSDTHSTILDFVSSQFPYLIFYLLFFYILVFKTTGIANFFLPKDGVGEKEINIQLHRHTVMTFAIFIASFQLILSTLEKAVRNILFLWNEMDRHKLSYLGSDIIPHLIIALIGAVFCFNAGRIANLFERSRRKANIN